jgi:hypothetical protein
MAKEQGLSLIDIGGAQEQVPVRGMNLNITGVSARGAISLIQRFPDMQKWFSGGGLTAAEMIVAGPDVIAAIIAAGTGHLNDEAHEKVADELPVEVQLDILEAIGRVTFKSGFGPFVKRIVALSNAVASVNYGKGPDTNLRPASKPSSPEAMEPVPGT